MRQTLSKRLLVAEEDRGPRIDGYSGRGPLGSWVHVAAVRAVVDVQRRWHPSETIDDLALRAAAPDPELSVLRTRYAPEFRQAFAEALSALAPRDRNVLRFHFLQGMTGDEVAAAYGVARRTVHRWLEEARDKLLGETRRRLGARVNLPAEELESVMRVLQTDLGSTVFKFLRGNRPDQ